MTEQFGLFETPKKQEVEIKHDDSIPTAPTVEPEQVTLIDKGEAWENHWKGMPEFVSKDLMPFKTIYVHFETRKEMDEFAKLVNQKITLDTQSIWYPEMEINKLIDKRWIDTI